MRIVLIGNATVQSDLSDEINSADWVVRFNAVTNNNFNTNTGVKTDVLCVTNLSAPGRLFAKFRQLQHLPFLSELKEIWFPRPVHKKAWQVWLKPWPREVFRKTDYSKFILSRNGLSGKKVVYFGQALFNDCCRMLEIADDFGLREPSTGFLALQYVVRNFDLTEHQLLLTGFMFSGVDTHPWEKEKKEVLKLQAKGLLRLVN